MNLTWLVTIVFLPLPTEILAVRSADEALVRFVYIASVLAVSVTMVALELVIDHAPEILIDPDAPRRGLAGPLSKRLARRPRTSTRAT